MQITYETYTLPNGLRVLLIPSDTTYSVSVKALVMNGSVHESDEEQGLSHFVEHLSLQATEKWPDQEKYVLVTEQNGASFNGTTSKESMDYYVNIPNTKLEFGIEFIYQTLYKSTFNPDYIEKERTVIIDEINKQRDEVYYRQFVHSLKTMSQNKSFYTRDIAGSIDKVSSYNRKQLLDHYEKIHDPQKVLIAIIGNFNKVEAKKLIEKYFWKIKSKYVVQDYPQDAVNENIFNSKFDHKTDMINADIILVGPADMDLVPRKYITFDLAIKILVGTSSSRLWNRLRMKEGLLYRINGSKLIYEKFGANFIYFEVKPNLFSKSYDIVIEEMVKFYDKGVTSSELEHVKEYVINRNLVNYDNIHTLSKLVVSPIFNSEPVLLLEELNETIKSISKEEVDQVIKEYFDIYRSSTILYGNTSEEIDDLTKSTLSKNKINVKD